MLTECYYPYRRSPYQNFWFNESTRWSLNVTVAPTEEPVSVSEVMEHTRIDDPEETPWLQSAISAARQLCETFTKRTFCSTTLRLNLDEFPWFDFVLPRPNLVSVTTIKYLDTSGVQQTLSASAYSVDSRSTPGRIVAVYNTDWPAYRNFTNSIEVIYVAGYGAATAVPESVKNAIKFTVADWYSNREDTGVLPPVAKCLLATECWGFVP